MCAENSYYVVRKNCMIEMFHYRRSRADFVIGYKVGTMWISVCYLRLYIGLQTNTKNTPLSQLSRLSQIAEALLHLYLL